MEEKTMMKALVRHKFGGPEVVRIEEVERPALEDDAILVRVRASSINKADLHALQGSPRLVRPISGKGLLRPKTPFFGVDFAGIVDAVGKDVTDVAPGDEVSAGRAAPTPSTSARSPSPRSRRTSRSKKPGRSESQDSPLCKASATRASSNRVSES
jgi:NADPH:quinone reductase-like Zn-dependent oxidoreductase